MSKDLPAGAPCAIESGAVSDPSDVGLGIRNSSVSVDDPWVFFPNGLDWTWISIRRARSLVRDAQRNLVAFRSERAGWSYRTREDPGTLVLDLALQGLPASWIRASAPEARGPDQGWDSRGSDDPVPDSEALEALNRRDSVDRPRDDPANAAMQASMLEVPLADPDAITSGWPWSSKAGSQVSRFTVQPTSEGFVKAAGDREMVATGAPGQELIVCGDPGHQESWGPFGINELEKAALRHPSGPDREVIVFSASLERLADRLAFTWMLAVSAAAAVVRESELGAATAWAHPSAIWLGPDAEERLLRLLEFAGGSSLRAQRRLMNRTARVFLVEAPQSSALRALARDLSFDLIEVTI